MLVQCSGIHVGDVFVCPFSGSEAYMHMYDYSEIAVWAGIIFQNVMENKSHTNVCHLEYI